jgi:mannosylglycerate hydrolase
MRKMHIISNSHLDREHRHEFQETRLMMVEMLDQVIQIMENDHRYRFFTLDGQAIVLEDYLELRPHMRDRLMRLTKAGRICIGPWYSLVDCYSVNPESIIRNLIIGDRVCKEFGKPMKVGYSIFSFGQMAQLPQIYAGFGIDDIVFYKGASAKAFPNSEFYWTAPDGSKAFTTRLGREKRWNFFFDFDIPVILGGNAKKPGWQSKFTDPVKLCHMVDSNYVNQYATELEPDIRIREEEIDGALKTVIDQLDETLAPNTLVAFDGTDFTSPLKEIPDVIEIINERYQGDIELIQSTPEMYFEEVKKEIDHTKLIDYTGEMRFGPVNHVHSETMGTNTEIKQSIWRAENTIISTLEPLMAMVSSYGATVDKATHQALWKHLLATHAHDSVHGSGDPKIKTDNLFRLEQVQCLADSLLRRTVNQLCRQIRFKSDRDDIRLVVMNTTPYPRQEVVKVVLDLPQDELVEDFWIYDDKGQEVPYYQLSKKVFNLASIHSTNRPKSVYCDRYELLLDIAEIPPMGYTTLTVKRQKGSNATSTNPFPIGIFPFNPIAKSGNVLDNGLLRVTLNSGSIDVYDYRTGLHAKELNAFTDTGCSGDFWVHRQPYSNRTITSKGAPTQIELLENSSLSATYRMTCVLQIPVGLNEDKTARLEQTRETKIVTDITLKKDSTRIEFKTRLDNRCKDHMLTVSFPTGIQAEKAVWEAPFELRERDVDNFTNDRLKKGPELERQAMQGFVNIRRDNCGVSLFSKGIREVGTTSDNQAIINLTLFRAVSSTFPIHNDLLISFDNEPSQCIGKQEFEYAVYFHGSEDDVLPQSRLYQTDVLVAQVGAGQQGERSTTDSLFTLSNNRTAVSCVKLGQDDDQLCIRLYNPTGDVYNETISFAKEVKSAYLTNMNEERLSNLDVEDNSVTLEISPYKIITLMVDIS